MELSTNELMKQLNSCSNIEDYLKENEEYFINTTVSEYLYNMFDEKCLKKSRIFEKAEINETYGYQILSGKKNPSRNVILSICIGANFTLNETQAALQTGNHPGLSPKNKRDSIIIYCINNHKSVIDTNLMLYEKGEDTLAVS